MIRKIKDSKRKLGSRLTAFFMAVVLLILPVVSGIGGPLTSFADTGTVKTLFSGNLLKDGASFSFYGKDSPRSGMWAYQVNGNPVFCLEPTKRMFNGAAAQIQWYDIATDELPYGITKEKAEALYYAMGAGGSFEGASACVARTQGGYMMMQSAVWAIMSDEWDIDTFKQEMENKIIPNARNSSVATTIRPFVDEYLLNAKALCQENACPAFASKYAALAPVHQLRENDDGTFSATFELDGSWMQNDLIYQVPEGWEYHKSGNEVTFICRNGNPNSGLIKGEFPEGSAGRRYLYRPSKLAIVTPEGSDASSRQAQIMMAGAKEPWEVYFQLGGSVTQTSGFTIPYERFEHEETFQRTYNINLTKTDSETGKPLKDSTFEVIEQFDFSQLDGTSLEEDQFEKDSQEGRFHNLSVCTERITTDADGILSHSDTKTYEYYKTYCGGHPDPIIEEIEVGDDASEEEEEEAEERNEELRRQAWEQWQECVDWCSENCDFHSVTEGNARDEMEVDRDEAYETFIGLERIYTMREVTARTGYIIHDVHNDDIPVDIVTFASSEDHGDGTVIGTYPGNRGGAVTQNYQLRQKERFADRAATASDAVQEQEPTISISENERNLVYAALATPSQAEEESAGPESPTSPEESAGLEEQEKQEETESAEMGNITDSIEIATGSDAKLRLYGSSGRGERGEAPDSGGWEWDGVLLPSEVSPIPQSEKDKSHVGYHFHVADHRTEGEIHINKRDLELYQQDDSDGKQESYGKTQGDATLENAVYGLYALDDIVHPDGITGKVFSAGELVSIGSTDVNGDASFVCITEESETSKLVENLYSEDNPNGNGWIGRPLILGHYYIQEISRSEGYELSKTGINLTESNRLGDVFTIAGAGSVQVSELGHRQNEWDGSFNDFTVTYYQTERGYDIILTGYPEDSDFYQVQEGQRNRTEHIITGTELVEKKDDAGNTVYQTAAGGEYKLDSFGNRILLFDEAGEPVYGTQPQMETCRAVIRLRNYITSLSRTPQDEGIEQDTVINPDYVLEEVNQALSEAGYRSGLDDYPWKVIQLTDDTNGGMIDEILEHCVSDSFWDSYRLDDIYEKDGNWFALLRYGYQALKNRAIYDPMGETLYIRQAGMLPDGSEINYYSMYGPGDYMRNGSMYTVTKQECGDLVFGEPISLRTCYQQLYETYAEGEFLLDADGEKIPVLVPQPVYSDIETTEYDEGLKPLEAEYNAATGITRIHIDTSDIDWQAGTGPQKATFRAVGPQTTIEAGGRTMAYADYLKEYRNASVSVLAAREPLAAGSYVKEAVLLYPGQWNVYQDAITREVPIIVLERNIKQAIKVTKDIAQDSYDEVNTYRIHRDPFTVLYGGYQSDPAKTLKGFNFKAYLRSDLINTGKLGLLSGGGYDYETFFNENPEYAESLAIQWDNPEYDTDGDLTTLHANRGGGKDSYYGTSIMLPYGVYVLVEQQPDTIPTKHYEVDTPKEVTLPFVPQIDSDGTVHDKVPSDRFLYDSQMTAEELMERYLIRFNEETHVIYAHNNDGDYMVFKYGQDPDHVLDCGNEVVSSYYKYSSRSENSGTQDGVYYEVYRDRDGVIVDYGVTLDGVATMTGVSTAIDRQFASALVPWSVLDERYGDIINDEGDYGNRTPGLTPEGDFNFVSFAAEDFENHFYSSRLRIEKLDRETGENIIHDGALFKIYAAKRDVTGNGATGVGGSGKVLFHPDGTPMYEEAEQIFLKDEDGAEIGLFRAFSTIRDGSVTVDGIETTEKRGVGYIETPQPLGAGAYVLVEVLAPPGYVKSAPIAFEVYSDEVEYYPDGGNGEVETADRYQYVTTVLPDGRVMTEDVSQIEVEDTPTHVQIHKVEAGEETLRYPVFGSEEALKARGDIELYYEPNGKFAGYGYAVKRFDNWSERKVTGTLEELKEQGGVRPQYGSGGVYTGTGTAYETYVARATLTMYQGLRLERTGAHEFAGVTVERNWNDSVLQITAENTGVDTDIRIVGTDQEGHDIWDVTEVKRPPVKLYRYNLKTGAVEQDRETGRYYGLDVYGRRVCYVDEVTGLAYVETDDGTPIAWPLDSRGKKIEMEQILVKPGVDGNDTIYTGLVPVTDENGLVIYYSGGEVIREEAEWQTPVDGPYEMARVPFGSYIIEESVVPHAQGYIQSMPIGIVVEETSENQEFFMVDDFTKLEIAKLDKMTEREVVGAKMTLYEADRIPDHSDRGWHLEAALDWEGNKIPYRSWISGYAYDDDGNRLHGENGKPVRTAKPHWLDHIPPGDYLLVEEETPEAGGYVRGADVEVIVEESGNVQHAVMYDDHTSTEFLKVDARTGQALGSETPAQLSLYYASLNEAGEVQYDEAGNPMYDRDRRVLTWQTEDGRDVAATGHESGGELVYDYDKKPVPGLEHAVSYVTETGALHIDYLPVGKYVWVEESAPSGMHTAAPIYVVVLEKGSEQSFVMENEPVTAEFSKSDQVGGKEITGATLALYRAREDGSCPKVVKTDGAGNPVNLLDRDGNVVYGMDGNPIHEELYLQEYLVERWLSGSDGRFTEEDQSADRIPEGYEIGDLRPHQVEELKYGVYYFVEEQTPFGYTRSDDIRVEITGKSGTIRTQMVNYPVRGRLEILKYDEKDDKPLAGAQFKLENLDTKEALILITDRNGYVSSGYMPIGEVEADGSISLYRFRLSEVAAPDHYELNPEEHYFSFSYVTDRVERITYHYGAANREIIAVLSKVDITDSAELEGAHMKLTDIQGNVIEEWISGTEPHEIIGKLRAGETYRLTEMSAPDGYAVSDSIEFTVGEDGRVEPVVMKDSPTDVVVSKRGITGEDELPGAHLQILDKTGQVVADWMSGETPYQLRGILLAGETYILHEETSPFGYAYAEDITFTVNLDGSVNHVVMRDKPTNVRIQKVGSDGTTGLSGAHLAILEQSGEMVLDWISDGMPHEITGVLEAGRTYILRELNPPSGYAYHVDVEFTVGSTGDTVSIVMEDTPTKASLSKKTLTGGEELEGALLQIRTITGEIVTEWVSNGTPHEVTGLLNADTDYYFWEVEPPAGFAYAEPVRFHVGKDGTTQPVSMYDGPTQVEIIKKGEEGQPLAGALLQLYDEAGNMVKEWISTAEPMVLTGSLNAGHSYRLHEACPPAGSAYAEDILFTVPEDGSRIRLAMEDRETQIAFEKKNEQDKPLSGAHLQVVDQAGNIVHRWVTDGEMNLLTGVLTAGETYTLVETQAPNGYRIAEPVTFTVGKDGSFQLVILYNRLKSNSGGGDNDKPRTPTMSIHKMDEAGQGLAGAEITVYREDQTVLLKGITGKDGRLLFDVPEQGHYTYRETSPPTGYLLSSYIGSFTVAGSGVSSDGLSITDKKSPEVILTKRDGETREALAGAELGIYYRGSEVFRGLTGEDGTVVFVPSRPGTYQYRELSAPKGYQITDFEYNFEVEENGSVTGDLELFNYKEERKIGSIYASYHGTGRFAGMNLQFGGLGTMTPGSKTGDGTPLFLYLFLFLASAWMVFQGKIRKAHMGKAAIVFMAAGTMAMGSAFPGLAAQEDSIPEDIITRERVFYADDMSNVRPKFEEVIKSDGRTYILVNVVTEEIPEEPSVEERSLTITSAPFPEGAEAPVPAETYRSPEDGLDYQIQTSEIVDVELEEQVKEVREEEIYEELEQADGIPGYSYLSVYDEITGKTYTKQVPLISYDFTDYHWVDGFEFPVTFVQYDAEHYALGNLLIEHNDETPDLMGNEEALLDLIGVDREYYRIDEISWAGDPWEGEDGVIYRSALATGQKLVGTCHAVYSGTVRIGGGMAKAVKTVYTALVPREKAQRRTIKSTATYQLTGAVTEDTVPEEKNLLERLISWFQRNPAAAAVGLLILLLFSVMVLRVIAKKRGKEENSTDSRWNRL